MATPKNITLADLSIGKIVFQLDKANILNIEGVYNFLDNQSPPQVVEQVNARRIARSVPWAAVPQNVKDGLIAVRDYLYNQALEDEGMEDPPT